MGLVQEKIVKEVYIPTKVQHDSKTRILVWGNKITIFQVELNQQLSFSKIVIAVTQRELLFEYSILAIFISRSLLVKYLSATSAQSPQPHKKIDLQILNCYHLGQSVTLKRWQLYLNKILLSYVDL